jgi:hypothetical protein
MRVLASTSGPLEPPTVQMNLALTETKRIRLQCVCSGVSGHVLLHGVLGPTRPLPQLQDHVQRPPGPGGRAGL